MDLWKSLTGMVEVELLCADPALALKQILAEGITVYHVHEGSDSITLRLRLRRQDHKKLRRLIKKRGYEWSLVSRGGIYWTIKALLNRPVMVCGMILFLFLSLYLPTRVLFFQVEGNYQIPSRQILEQCAQIGIGFGASRREVRSEKVKNALLESIPELQWVGVNTSGCVGTITVKERSDEPALDSPTGVSSIVANRDGIITSCTASRGNLLCRPGQVVTAGEVLISGYTDCGLSIQATQAEGEVFAQTSRNISAIYPKEHAVQGKITDETKKYAFIIGKYRINFYKGSGISGTTCDKMYEENYVTLPGGFVLPVGFVTETWIAYECSPQESTAEQADTILSVASSDYLKSTMVAGTVLKAVLSGEEQEDAFVLQGKYACLEMIGQVRNEEIIKPYGK